MPREGPSLLDLGGRVGVGRRRWGWSQIRRGGVGSVGVGEENGVGHRSGRWERRQSGSRV